MVVIAVALNWIALYLVDFGHRSREWGHGEWAVAVSGIEHWRREASSPPDDRLALDSPTVAPGVLVAKGKSMPDEPVVVTPALSRPLGAGVVDVCHAVLRDEVWVGNVLRQPPLESLTLQAHGWVEHSLPPDPVRCTEKLRVLEAHLRYMFIAHVLSCSNRVLVQMEDVH